MPFPRLTWVGLLLATLGWGFLIAYPLIGATLSERNQLGGAVTPAEFVPLIGENAVLTGLAIAILGALQRALRLLSKIASQGTQSRSRAPQTLPANRMVQAPVRQAAAPANGANAVPSAEGPRNEPFLLSRPGPQEVVTRGALNGRDYVLFRDGSVIVETLLGPRRFTSITEAQEFIGGRVSA